MLIPSYEDIMTVDNSSLSRRVNANSQQMAGGQLDGIKLIKKGEC